MNKFIEVTVIRKQPDGEIKSSEQDERVLINIDDIMYLRNKGSYSELKIRAINKAHIVNIKESYDGIKDKLLAPELPFAINTTYVHDSEDDE